MLSPREDGAGGGCGPTAARQPMAVEGGGAGQPGLTQCRIDPLLPYPHYACWGARSTWGLRRETAGRQEVGSQLFVPKTFLLTA